MSYGGVGCVFSGRAFDVLTYREKRNYDLLKAAVLEDRGFSSFDLTTLGLARLFARLVSDPELAINTELPFPWVGVSLARTGLRLVK